MESESKELRSLTEKEIAAIRSGMGKGKIFNMDLSNTNLESVEKYLYIKDNYDPKQVYDCDSNPVWWLDMDRVEYLGVHFENACISETRRIKFDSCVFSGCTFTNDMVMCDFIDCDMRNVTFKNTMRGCKFARCGMQESVFDGAVFEGTKFILCYMQGVKFDGKSSGDMGEELPDWNASRVWNQRSYFDRCDFLNADLSKAPMSMFAGHRNINIMYLNNLGSRNDDTYAVRHDDDVMIRCGCFWGSLREFEDEVYKTHRKCIKNTDPNNAAHKANFFAYMAAIRYIHDYALWYWDMSV